MLRKDCVSTQGLEQTSETDSGEDSGQNAPEASAPPFDGESSPPDENRSRTGDRDPHICKEWPCPQCHKPRDPQQQQQQQQEQEQEQEQEENIRVAEQQSLRPAASTQTTIFRSDPESQNMEQSESEDD